jgi:hypothetical protein
MVDHSAVVKVDWKVASTVAYLDWSMVAMKAEPMVAMMVQYLAGRMVGR